MAEGQAVSPLSRIPSPALAAAACPSSGSFTLAWMVALLALSPVTLGGAAGGVLVAGLLGFEVCLGVGGLGVGGLGVGGLGEDLVAL